MVFKQKFSQKKKLFPVYCPSAFEYLFTDTGKKLIQTTITDYRLIQTTTILLLQTTTTTIVYCIGWADESCTIKKLVRSG
jgi:hypothetical protein